MMAELMGRVTGYCKGLGGSMHIADLELNILGANGIVGAGIGIGTGAALSNKLRGNGAVGVVFFGDGAMQRGHLSTSVSTSPRCGSCRWCICARTTSTGCPPR